MDGLFTPSFQEDMVGEEEGALGALEEAKEGINERRMGEISGRWARAALSTL